MAILAAACGLVGACSSSSDPMTQFGFTPAALKAAGESDVAGFAAPESPSARTAAALPSTSPQAAAADGETVEAARDDTGPGAAGESQPVATAEDPSSAKSGFLSSLFSRAAEKDGTRPGATAVPDTVATAADASVEEERTADAGNDAAASIEAAEGMKDDSVKPGFFASLFSTTPERDEPESSAGTDASEPAASELQVARAEEEKPAGDTDTPDKRSFLMALFSPTEEPSPRQSEVVETLEERIEDDAAEMEPIQASFGGDVLPGVRDSEQLFEVVRKSNIDDISDVDLYEGEGTYQVASAAGLARLAPHGLLKQREDVDVACFKPELVRMLKTIERRFGKRVVVTSGYRSPAHNRRVRGARRSQHMVCAAADIQLSGVSKWELARFVRSLPGRGGVGTYCHTKSVHVDVGPERDWNWRCRG